MLADSKVVPNISKKTYVLGLYSEYFPSAVFWEEKTALICSDLIARYKIHWSAEFQRKIRIVANFYTVLSEFCAEK